MPTAQSNYTIQFDDPPNAASSDVNAEFKIEEYNPADEWTDVDTSVTYSELNTGISKNIYNVSTQIKVTQTVSNFGCSDSDFENITNSLYAWKATSGDFDDAIACGFSDFETNKFYTEQDLAQSFLANTATVWSNRAFSSTFNGATLYYKVSGINKVFQINTSGVITDIVDC